MKRFVTLCIVCTVFLFSSQAISAAGMADAGAGLSGSEGTTVSQEITSSEGAPFDAGNNARTGDFQSRTGIDDGTASGTANGETTGESGENSSETGDFAPENADSAGNSATDNGVTADENPIDGSVSGDTGRSGGNWFSIILAIVIVAAIAALIVALLPRRNRS